MTVPFLSLHDVTAMHGEEIREAAKQKRLVRLFTTPSRRISKSATQRRLGTFRN